MELKMAADLSTNHLYRQNNKNENRSTKPPKLLKHSSSNSLSTPKFLSPSSLLRLVHDDSGAAWADRALRPPPPKLAGTPGGPAITAPRIKLRDGRHLTYKEYGVPRDKANHKFIFIHGFDSCRLHAFIATEVSPDTIEKLGLHIVGFDRPGFGESDPDANRTPKSLALDVEELADQLGFGSKFYVVGYSMGGEATWGVLKYIPHRLARASLITPVVNYWWSNLPANLTKEAYYKMQLPQDQWSLRVAHYAPWLTYWWQTQKWFPPSSVIDHSRDILSRQNKLLMSKFEKPEFAVLNLAVLVIYQQM